jgi:hypothetical protein
VFWTFENGDSGERGVRKCTEGVGCGEVGTWGELFPANPRGQECISQGVLRLEVTHGVVSALNKADSKAAQAD